MVISISGYWFRNQKFGQPVVAVISVSELRNEMNNGAPVMIDVRTPGEYIGPLGHIEGSMLIPLHELENRLHELEKYKSEKIVMICRSGNRSGTATALLIRHGFKARNMIGGMIKWNTEK